MVFQKRKRRQDEERDDIYTYSRLLSSFPVIIICWSALRLHTHLLDRSASPASRAK